MVLAPQLSSLPELSSSPAGIPSSSTSSSRTHKATPYRHPQQQPVSVTSSVTRGRKPSVRSSAASSSKEPLAMDDTSAFLPLRLPRLARLALVDVDALPDLNGVPESYILERLTQYGPTLLQHALAPRPSLPPTASSHQALSPPLPETLTFDLNRPVYTSASSPFSLPPNYVLAVRPPPSSPAGTPQAAAGLLLPIHDLVYRASCAHLPSFPARSPFLPPSTLPIISITLPSPSALQPVHHFLYTRRPDVLLSSLLNLPPALDRSAQRSRAELKVDLAAAVDLLSLMERVNVVHQVWQCVVALGLGDSLFWKALDAAWEVLVGAVAIVQARAAVPAPTARLTTAVPAPTRRA